MFLRSPPRTPNRTVVRAPRRNRILEWQSLNTQQYIPVSLAKPLFQKGGPVIDPNKRAVELNKPLIKNRIHPWCVKTVFVDGEHSSLLSHTLTPCASLQQSPETSPHPPEIGWSFEIGSGTSHPIGLQRHRVDKTTISPLNVSLGYCNAISINVSYVIEMRTMDNTEKQARRKLELNLKM